MATSKRVREMGRGEDRWRSEELGLGFDFAEGSSGKEGGGGASREGRRRRRVLEVGVAVAVEEVIFFFFSWRWNVIKLDHKRVGYATVAKGG